MVATKQMENIIVLLLEEGYSKLDEQKNSVGRLSYQERKS
jgi:hypothetical protein